MRNTQFWALATLTSLVLGVAVGIILPDGRVVPVETPEPEIRFVTKYVDGPVNLFLAAQQAPRNFENIEVVVDGQIVHLVGPGAESVLPYFGEAKTPQFVDTTN